MAEMMTTKKMYEQLTNEPAEASPELGMKVGDALMNALPKFGLSDSRGSQSVRKQRKLDDAARAAQALAEYDDVRDTSGLKLFEDAAASKEAAERAKSKINPARRLEVEGLKKGGAVRGWGKARGARAAKVY